MDSLGCLNLPPTPTECLDLVSLAPPGVLQTMKRDLSPTPGPSGVPYSGTLRTHSLSGYIVHKVTLFYMPRFESNPQPGAHRATENSDLHLPHPKTLCPDPGSHPDSLGELAQEKPHLGSKYQPPFPESSEWTPLSLSSPHPTPRTQTVK